MFFLPCPACGLLNDSQIEHIIVFCKATDRQRKLLWQKIYTNFGMGVFLKFIMLKPSEQVLTLFSALQNILSDEKQILQCQTIIMFSIYDMVKSCALRFKLL